jgi:hypothetical protein
MKTVRALSFTAFSFVGHHLQPLSILLALLGFSAPPFLAEALHQHSRQ